MKMKEINNYNNNNDNNNIINNKNINKTATTTIGLQI